MTMTTTSTDAAVISIAPIVVDAPGRQIPLHVRVTFPAQGGPLPVILLSHGLGHSMHLSSMDGYAPLASLWAAAGFIVIQPTHMDSRSLGLEPDDPQRKTAWKTRPTDMTHILDHLPELESSHPLLRGRIDAAQVAIAGHSMGGHTAGLLLGMQTTDPETGERIDAREPRITAGIILAAPGRGEVLTPFATEHLPFLRGSDFTTMTAPALVVVGDADTSEALNTEGPDWLTDSYRHAPSPKTLLTVHRAGHILGGISGWDTLEARDEHPEHVSVVASVTAAYLHARFSDEDEPTALATAFAEAGHRLDQK
jgi:predicted alpha/beta-hydrolase family hydrolase